MIQAKNFRIGNYYQPTDGSGEVAKVTWEDLRAWDQGAVYGKEIRITEDWLIELGLIKEGSYWIPKGTWHRYVFHGHCLNFEPQSDMPIPITQVTFVHEFQNLFFALTSRELPYENT